MTTASSTTTAASAATPTRRISVGSLPVRYVLLEAKRQLRNVRALVFTFAVPVIMMLIFGAAYGGHGAVDPITKLPEAVVVTLQMAAYGAMMAALSQAFAIVNERAIGWNRQLRATPLSGTAFLVSKIIASLVVAACSIIVVCVISVLALGTSMSVGHWLAAGFAIWAGVIPFSLIAILIGLYAKPSFAQPLFMVVFMGMAILGGLWVPLSIMPSWMTTVAQALPSYWLNRMGQTGAGAAGALGEPIMVLGLWAVVLCAVIVWRYRRDAARQ
jgi:ABC-2 type transport system permease protein